jgi:hypothetical protein
LPSLLVLAAVQMPRSQRRLAEVEDDLARKAHQASLGRSGRQLGRRARGETKQSGVIDRRTFLSYGAGMVAAPISAQQAIMEGKKAVVCSDGVVRCPQNHETCRTIDLPLAVGNDSLDYPEVYQLRSKRVLCCDVCGCLFVKVS